MFHLANSFHHCTLGYSMCAGSIVLNRPTVKTKVILFFKYSHIYIHKYLLFKIDLYNKYHDTSVLVALNVAVNVPAHRHVLVAGAKDQDTAG